ncbi:piwi-like protein Siwi [Copidosoma floridanum]|uniref:piwi-like protein Siwi n=1 Tax=Copidosoma floridanum TaxID=29053 RepID=UPI0006C9D748|nr:piwi-like protein Siwi [Copidosoma floridanum]
MSSRQQTHIPLNEICTRPQGRTTKKGQYGEHVTLQANYFKLTSHPDWTLNQYRVDIAPEEDRTSVKKAYLRLHKDVLGAYIFDGTMLYTCHALTQPLELNSIRESDQRAISIKIRLAATVVRGDYHYFQVFNIIMRKCLEHLQLALVGRNFYDPERGVTIQQHGLKVWPGYITSIRQHEAGIMMCVEISHKVMRTDTVYDTLMKCYEKDSKNYKDLFKKSVLGLVVITHYNNRTYKVDDVDFSTSPLSTFQKRDSSAISYGDYYRDKHKVTIKDSKQPLLVSKATARDRRAGVSELVYLIPELCYSTGITDAMRQDMNLMKALTDKTRINPSDRINKLLDFHTRLNSKSDIKVDFANWDLEIDDKLIEIPARVFPRQKIGFGNNVTVETRNAEWDLHKVPKQLMSVGQLTDWTVIYPAYKKQEMQEFIQATMSVAGKMGFSIKRPSIISVVDDRPDTYSNIISELTNRSVPQTVLCVVPNNQQQRYMAIKKKLCIERPIPSQVILAKTLTHRNVGSIACKVAVQLNCKLGGSPWSIDLTSVVKGLMVVGFDVCHEKSSDGTDFGAMVSSLDQKFGRYYSAVTQHKSGEELSDCILKHLDCSIREFHKANTNRLPNYIIIYRDGVGEGQIPFVYDYEVRQIKRKLEELYANESINPKRIKLKFSFIIVTKRINTRLFFRRNNPVPGTVVDDVITDPLKYDFFIVSQNVKQGTVSPTAYNVIEDSTGLSPDHLQFITYKLCHMYFNFNGTVRVPAPCQYAHKLALFISQTLRQPAHTNLQSLLYFL